MSLRHDGRVATEEFDPDDPGETGESKSPSELASGWIELTTSQLGAIQALSESLAPVLRAIAGSRAQAANVRRVANEAAVVAARSESLMRNSLTDSLKRIQDTFNRVWIPQFASIAERLARSGFPANLCGVDGVSIGTVLSIAEEDGIALYGVPSVAVTRRILSAATPQARRRILGDSLGQIVTDCASAVGNVSDPKIRPLAKMLSLAARAAAAGHTEAAQALATNVLDSALHDLVDAELQPLARARRGGNGARERAELVIREALVVLPLARAHVTFDRKKGDIVPQVFSRHATVHVPGARQYSKRNTSQVLLLATSLLLFVAKERDEVSAL